MSEKRVIEDPAQAHTSASVAVTRTVEPMRHPPELSRGLDIAELRTGPLDLTMVPPPPTNPYRAAETEATR